MQTWKRKQPSARRGSAGTAAKPWQVRVASAVFLLVTVAAGFSSFPAPWNAAASAVKAKTGLNVPMIPDAKFRLGLDLQGGTHLVYDLDMSQIPQADRDSALSGVRDVIERRVNAFGVSEPLVQTTNAGGTYRLIVELAGVLDVKQAIAQIGETPVLEFKEPDTAQSKPTSADDAKKLAAAQAPQRKAAADVLALAMKPGADFDALVKQYSVESDKATTGGKLGDFNTKSVPYGAIAQAIVNTRSWTGRVVPQVIETTQGLEVVKMLGLDPKNEETQLSHILICYTGATGCTTLRSEIEATTKINELKAQATPANFAQLAKDNSTDTGSAANGGKLDPSTDNPWVEPGQMVLPFELAARTTKVGAISDVVKTDFGYHLIYKRASRPTTTYQVERILLPLAKLSDVVPPVSPWKNTQLSGKNLTRASVQFDQRAGTPYVSLQFDDAGGKLFGELTARLVGQPIGIFLDGQPISTPVVQQAIYGGQAIINGTFSLDEAKLLAQRLNAGALPVPIKLLSQQTVGPTLGLASLNQSVKAALIGFALVALFMIALYRLPGIMAILALLLYAVVNMLCYRLFGVTMTLAGIAGLVLSLGIAVDANVLIFERIKDEARAGHDLEASLREGFKRAWPPIRDGHLTTLISAVVLYNFSSSFVRGFALTLAIGVILSLFTAITVVRVYLRALTGWKIFQKPWLFSIRPSAKDSGTNS